MASETKKQQTFHCDECDMSFNAYMKHYNHKRSFHMGIIYKCDKCTHTSKHKGGLKNHIETHHNGVTHPCEECGKIYS